MTQEHPITPSQEVVHQWAGYAKGYNIPGTVIEYIATQAARWGADMELEACCEWLNCELGTGWGHGTKLRSARRPEPPSLKEQALEALDRMDQLPTAEDQHIIRRALEALPD